MEGRQMKEFGNTPDVVQHDAEKRRMSALAEGNIELCDSSELARPRISNGFGCSDCAWRFTASEPLVGNSVEEMRQHCEAQRDQEFKAHVCADHPKKRVLAN
jgi:hypothetical protein